MRNEPGPKTLSQNPRAVEARAYYAKNKEKSKAAVMKWRRAHPEKHNEYQRTSMLRKQYGMSTEDYETLLANQGGVCAICRKRGPVENGRSLSVDHDHATGQVRGLLCLWCNRAIGLLADDAAMVRSAAEYLERMP